MTSFIRTSDHLTIVFDDGVTAYVYENSPQYAAVVAALKQKNYELARKLAIPAEVIKNKVHKTYGVSDQLVTIEHGIVSFKGTPMHNTLTSRMVQMLEEGFDIEPLKLFLINLQNNPSFRAVNELYGFLEKGNLPITDDGYFLAYKKVRDDYTDVHTGKFNNSVGQIVEMPRNHVDEDSRNECSAGLHFCSREYLANFGGQRIMIVKINPADVVAIPADYNSSKGRACRYEVIGELEQNGKLEGAYRSTTPAPVAPVEDEFYEEDEDDFDDEEDDTFDGEDDDGLDALFEGVAEIVNELNILYGQSSADPSYSTDEVEDADASDDHVVEDAAGNLVATVDPLKSGFAGLPDNGEPVMIPRSVALEIASELEDDNVELVYSVHPTLETRIKGYGSVRQASEDTGANESSIRKVLNGQRETAGGLRWERSAD